MANAMRGRARGRICSRTGVLPGSWKEMELALWTVEVVNVSIILNHALDEEMNAAISGRWGADRVSLSLNVGGYFVSVTVAVDTAEFTDGFVGSRLRIIHWVLLMCNVVSILQDAVKF